jgi:hypothetical protein
MICRDGAGALVEKACPSATTHCAGKLCELSTVSARVAGGRYHSLALRSDGMAWGWGHNYCGQLGDGTRTNRTSPVEVSDLELHPRLHPQLIVAKYYYFGPLPGTGGQRVATRRNGVLQYIAGDHPSAPSGQARAARAWC